MPKGNSSLAPRGSVVSVGTMDPERAVSLLTARQHKERLEGITFARSFLQPAHMVLQTVIPNGQVLQEFLKAVAQALVDANWNVKREAIALASELLPANAIAANYLVTNLLVSLCDTKVTIRKAAIAAVSNWLASTRELDKAFELLDKRGMQNLNPQVRAEVLNFVQSDQVRRGTISRQTPFSWGLTFCQHGCDRERSREREREVERVSEMCNPQPQHKLTHISLCVFLQTVGLHRLCACAQSAGGWGNKEGA